MIPAPTPMPVALRAYTERKTAEPTTTGNDQRPPTASKRARREPPKWQPHVLVFDTETTADAVQRLTFGSYRVCKWNSRGTLDLVSEGLVYADDLAHWNASALATLREYASVRNLPLLSRREFMESVFRLVALDMEGTVVGFNLPFDLSRLAISAGEARGRYFGGFSFALWDYEKPAGVWQEHPFRPRIAIKSLDSKRAFIGFTRPLGTNGAEPTFRGHFLDMRTLAFALSGTGHSLATACRAFGVEHAKLAVEEHGVVTEEYIDYNRRDVLATQELLERLRERFDALGLSLAPTRTYSPASLAKAALRDMRIRPVREKAPTVTSEHLGRAMNAFYGGRAECRIRRVSVPVVTVDFRSMYPTVNCLLGLWPVLTAEEVAFVDATEDFCALIAKASPSHARLPETWPQLNGFVEVEPDEDILPVRAPYSDTRDGLNIGVNYLTSLAPLVYAAPDVYASALLTGKTPRIKRAWKMVPKGTQDGLRPIRLSPEIVINPSTDDFFRRVIEERVRVKNSPDYSPETRDQVSQYLKILANSGSYGIFAEINLEDLPADTAAEITVFGNGASFSQTTRTPEDIGTYCFPPIAALIASGARLMLAMLDRAVTDRDGTYGFADTDSMAIVATEHAGLIEMEGGTADESDRIEAIRALSWADVRDIQASFDSLNPYDKTVIPTILNIEDVNFAKGKQREIFAYVISAKRYALFAWNADGSISLLKGSEHGLGHLVSPLQSGTGKKFSGALWELILAEELGISHDTPEWLTFPAVSRVSISSPAYFRGFLRGEAEKLYQERIKPFGFVLSAQVARLGHPEGTDPKRFRLLSPYSTDPRKWADAIWTDAYSEGEFAISTSLSYQPGVVRVKSIADVKAEFLAHGEVKSATSDGEPAEGNARGLLQRRHVIPSEIRLIGKESNALELVEAGFICDWDAILSSYGIRGRPTPEMLRSQSAAAIARAWKVSVRTVRSWRASIRRATPNQSDKNCMT